MQGKTDYNDLKSFKVECEQNLGTLLDPSRPMICIPKEYMFFIESPPSDNPRPEISIDLLFVQIIEINMKLNQITAHMEFRVHWTEDERLDLATSPNKWILIKEENIQQKIWSPEIDIGQDLVAQKRQNHKLRLAKDFEDNNSTLLKMNYDFFTTVKCPLIVFKTFPFDKQECTIWVRIC